MLLKEACLENYTHLEQAIALGANRIELCDNLAVGGTTVSYAVLKQSIAYAQTRNVPIMAIIRARGGDFVYSTAEKEIMLADLQMAKELGVAGVVIGALTTNNWLDEDFLLEMLAIALDPQQPLMLTFHMAFDQIPKEQQFLAIDWLVKHKISRILTHGGKADTDILANIEHLQQLMDYAGERLIILPGGGINLDNLKPLVEKLNPQEVHGTKIVGELGNP